MSEPSGIADEPDSDSDPGTPRWRLAALGLAVTWVFVTAPARSPSAVAGAFLLGLAFGVPVAYLARSFFPGRTDLRRLPRAVPAALRYVAFFLRDLVVANVSVARRVLDPALPLDPGVVDVPLRVETPAAITTIANSITLTPGTLTLDYRETDNSLRVHVVDIADVDALVATVRRWEDYALQVFDEDANPGDSAPPVTVDPGDTYGPADAESDAGVGGNRDAAAGGTGEGGDRDE